MSQIGLIKCLCCASDLMISLIKKILYSFNYVSLFHIVTYIRGNMNPSLGKYLNKLGFDEIILVID
jgi:hypothetical protein